MTVQDERMLCKILINMQNRTDGIPHTLINTANACLVGKYLKQLLEIIDL